MNESQKEFLRIAEAVVEDKGENVVEVLTSSYPVETSFGEAHLSSPALRGLEKRGHIEIIRSFWRGALIRLSN